MKKKRTNIWLLIKNTKDNYSYFKYFETEFEKDTFKRKIHYIPFLWVIEDSSDMDWNYS